MVNDGTLLIWKLELEGLEPKCDPDEDGAERARERFDGGGSCWEVTC